MSINKVILVGNVGIEPTLRNFDNGGAACNITIATTDKGFKTKDGREIPDKTEWHNVVFKNQLAQVASKYLHKGDKVYIEGKLQTREYLKDNVKHYVTEIIVKDFEFMQGKGGGNGGQQPTTPQPSATRQTTNMTSSPFDFLYGANDHPF